MAESIANASPTLLKALQQISAEERHELLKALEADHSSFTQFNFGQSKNFQVSVEQGGTANNAETININNILKVDLETLRQVLEELTDQTRQISTHCLNHQAALASAQTTAMLIVDLMRMLYVVSNDEARSANMARYNIFVDIANNHFSEMRSQSARFATQLSVELLNLSTEIERDCAWVYGQLKGPPDVTQDINRCYEVMYHAASQTFEFCSDAIPETFLTIVQDVDNVMAIVPLPESPSNIDLFRNRLNAQTELLKNLKINSDNIRTIAHDVSQRMALYYFVIDYQLLNASQSAA